MPELPEVETVMRGLLPVMVGNKIRTVKLHRKDLRIPFPLKMQEKLKNIEITALTRRAKYILVHFKDGKILAIHLGMSGRVLIVPPEDKYDLQKHDHMVIGFHDGAKVIYNDPRRFGMIFILNDDELETHKAFAHLGPEPLGNNFSSSYLKETLKNKKTSIKQALLDQRVVVGVGNIYACEALFMAGISPEMIAGDLKGKKAQLLVECIRDVLTRAIEAGGSTLKDFAHADGELGYFQHSFSVYNREKQACQGCNCDIDKTGGVQRITQSGRSTFYCPKKQK